MLWLEHEHPELVEKYRYMYYGVNSYAPKEYRTWLAAKIQPLLRKHGLTRGEEDKTTGGVVTSAARTSFGEWGARMPQPSVNPLPSIIAEELPPDSAIRALGTPTLF